MQDFFLFYIKPHQLHWEDFGSVTCKNKQTNKQTNKWLALIGSVTLRLCHCQMKFMFDCGIFNHHFIFGKQYVFFHLFGVLKYIVD